MTREAKVEVIDNGYIVRLFPLSLRETVFYCKDLEEVKEKLKCIFE